MTNRFPDRLQRARKARRREMRRPLVTVDDVRSIASTLPRSYEAVVHGRVKFRVGRIVYVAFSRDETILGFGFPKELRDALVESAPHKFILPRESDLRYNWVCVRLDAVDRDELWALVVSAWRMCVPKKVAAAYERLRGDHVAESDKRRRPRRSKKTNPA